VFIRLLLALVLLPGLITPAAAQGAAGSKPPEIAKALAEVASSDAAVQEAAAVVLGKTGDRKILPLLEALREGSVYVQSLPGGKKETVIVGDKVTEGDKTMVPLFSAYGREPIVGPGGKPLLIDLSKLEEVATGRSLRLVLRPLIDAFSGQTQLTDPDWTVRQAAAVKMGNGGDAGSLPALTEALAKENDRWVRYALEEAIALIQLKSGSPAERGIAATLLGAIGHSHIHN
jgi:urea transport system permease protein